MPGTNVVAAKKALLAKVGAIPALAKVQILYTWTADAEREVVFSSNATFEREVSDMGNDPAETAVVPIHIIVAQPGGTEEDAEARAVEIGGIIEASLTADPRLDDAVPGLLFAGIEGGQVDSAKEDEVAFAELVYRVSVLSHLR